MIPKHETPEYIKQALADRDWWREFGARFGWQLYGFNYRDVATFKLKSGDLFEITREAKVDIEASLDSGKAA